MPIHLNRSGIFAPIPPMFTGHAVGTVETAELPTCIRPSIFMPLLSTIHLTIFPAICLPVFLAHITDMAHSMIVPTTPTAIVTATARSTVGRPRAAVIRTTTAIH